MARREGSAPLAVSGLGMLTSVGAGAAASCAAIRARMARFSEIEGAGLTDEEGAPVRVVASPILGVTDGYAGLGRFTRMAAHAIRDLLEGSGLSGREVGAGGLYVALPEIDRPGTDARLATELGGRIERWCGIRGAAGRIRVFSIGHAGVIHALEAAISDLDAGRVTTAVVGGVDSLVGAASLAHLHAKRRLKTGDRPVGLIPGEAAAFALVEPLARARARGAAVLATVEGASTATEAVTVDSDAPCDATGLCEATRRTLDALPDGGRETGLVISDLDGGPYRSEEFAYLAARAFHGFSGPFRLWHAADCIGDTGAASAAVSIGIGAMALARGYAKTSGALVLASSDGGARGAAYLRTAPEEKG